MEKAPEEKSELEKRVVETLTRTGGTDSPLLRPIKFHLIMLRDSNTVDEIETRYEVSQYLLSKMFLDKLELLPYQPIKCKIDENSDWPVPPRPSELFGRKKQEPEQEIDRQWWAQQFYKTVKDGDVLDCKVVEVLPLHGHRLRVLHRHGVPRILENLKLEVFLKTDQNELEVLESELLPNELVRVAVCYVKQVLEVYTINVTVYSKKLPAAANLQPMPKLGRISQDDIPSYVFDSTDTKEFSSYSHYLRSKRNLINPQLYDDLIEGLGLDSKRLTSFLPQFNYKSEPKSANRRELSNLGSAKIAANKALKHLEKEEYDEAIKEIDNALKVCPSDDILKSKLYDIQSDIHSKKLKKVYNLKSICDLELAFKSPNCDEAIKQKFLDKMFKVANSYLRNKNYKKAAEGFECIIKYDENHRLASKALEHLKSKHPEVFLNLEEMSQIDLQEKKKEIITELQKMKIL